MALALTTAACGDALTFVALYGDPGARAPDPPDAAPYPLLLDAFAFPDVNEPELDSGNAGDATDAAIGADVEGGDAGFGDGSDDGG